MYYTMYDCPKCGRKESSHDGYTFCGKCEEEYRKSEEERLRHEEEEREEA